MAAVIGFRDTVDLIHRPGEAVLARQLLELLGCEPVHAGACCAGQTSRSDMRRGVCIAEVPQDQWAFELWLQESVNDANNRNAYTFVKSFGGGPKAQPLLSLYVETLSEWEYILARIKQVIATDSRFAGRLRIAHEARCQVETAANDCVAPGAALDHAILYTDILSTGLLILGQNIEVVVQPQDLVGLSILSKLSEAEWTSF